MEEKLCQIHDLQIAVKPNRLLQWRAIITHVIDVIQNGDAVGSPYAHGYQCSHTTLIGAEGGGAGSGGGGGGYVNQLS